MRPRKLSKRQKLIIQKKKKEKARKPSTKKEKEKVFPGSGDLTSLGKGIITRTRESKEPDEGHQEEDLPGLEKTIPDNWGHIMSDDPATQEAFRNRVQGAMLDATRDSEGPHRDIPSEYIERLSDRLQQIQDQDPSFLTNLAHILEPLIELEGEERKEMRNKDFEHYAQDSIEEKKSRPLTHKTREQIKKTCQRYGLGRSFQDLLVMMNQISTAQSGKLFKKD